MPTDTTLTGHTNSRAQGLVVATDRFDRNRQRSSSITATRGVRSRLCTCTGAPKSSSGRSSLSPSRTLSRAGSSRDLPRVHRCSASIRSGSVVGAAKTSRSHLERLIEVSRALEDPLVNRRCGVKILSTLVAKDGVVARATTAHTGVAALLVVLRIGHHFDENTAVRHVTPSASTRRGGTHCYSSPLDAGALAMERGH